MSNYNTSATSPSKFNFNIVFWGLVFVVILYDFIDVYLTFSYTDELFTLLLVAAAVVNTRRREKLKEMRICILVFIFYLLYSLLFGTNTQEAVWMDFLIEIKPYLVFYCVCALNIQLSPGQKKRLHKYCTFIAPLLLPIGILTQMEILNTDIGGPRFCTMVTIVGILFLYSSKKQKRDIINTLIIWSMGFIPMKGKFIGFFMLAVLLFFFMGQKKIKLNVRYIIFGLIALFCVYFVAREKIMFYYIGGSQSDIMFARPALYFGAQEILRDYFPFGSGFGSYASFASGIYPSRLYWSYDVTRFSELSEGLYISDTFFPSLAQYGIAGIILFCLFWKKRWQDIQTSWNPQDIISYKCLILIAAFFLIESFADSTYTQNRGLYMFLILGVILNEHRKLRIS